MAKKKFDAVGVAEDETPINEDEAPQPEPPEDPHATEPLPAPISEPERVQDKEVPNALVSKRHASHNVVLGWLLDHVSARDDAEALRAAILTAIARSKDHGLLEVLDNVRAYIESHDRSNGV